MARSCSYPARAPDVLLGQTIWLHELPSWGLFVLALAVAWRLTRGGGGSAVSELSKANEVLTRRVQELGGEVRDLRVENERLRSRTDFAAVIATHEEHAQQRHDSQLRILALMAERLGADPD